MIDGWFPRLRKDGVVASGANSIWITPTAAEPFQYAIPGARPCWADDILVFNLKNGSSKVGDTIIPIEYNEYQGSNSHSWAGVIQGKVGQIDIYNNTEIMTTILGGCLPRFGGERFAYATPYQAPGNIRDLIVNGKIVATNTIMEVAFEEHGVFYLYQIATGVYTRQILDDASKAVNIRDDENLVAAFIGPDNRHWLVTVVNDYGVFIYPVGDTMGYRINDELLNPDVKMFGDKLRVVASHSNGEPQFNTYIDFTASRVDLSKLAPPVTIANFKFTHPVLVRPFKAEGSGVPDLFTLGTYKEGGLPNPMPEGRLLLGHDSGEDWVLPQGLRPYDIPLIEYYRDPKETLGQSIARWDRQTNQLLAQWRWDCGVIPMFYTQFRWTMQQIMDGLSALDSLVNKSGRLKVIAPFAYNRANGIRSFPELEAAFSNLVMAGQNAGEAPLLPVLVPKPEPPDPEPPKPESDYRHHKGVKMKEAIGVLRGPSGRLARVDNPNTGPWAGENAGWRGLVFDGSNKDDERYHFLRKDSALISKQTDAVIGCDATLHSGALDKQFYCKPDGEKGQGWAETFQFYDGNANGAIQAVVEYAPGSGGDDGAFFSYALAFEVIG